MDRRRFLKLTGKVLAVCVVPIPTVTEPIPKPKTVKGIDAPELPRGYDAVRTYFDKMLLSHNEPKLVSKQFIEQTIFSNRGKPIVFRKWAEMELPRELIKCQLNYLY